MSNNNEGEELSHFLICQPEAQHLVKNKIFIRK